MQRQNFRNGLIELTCYRGMHKCIKGSSIFLSYKALMDTYKIATAEVYKTVQYLDMLSMLVVVSRLSRICTQIVSHS